MLQGDNNEAVEENENPEVESESESAQEAHGEDAIVGTDHQSPAEKVATSPNIGEKRVLEDDEEEEEGGHDLPLKRVRKRPKRFGHSSSKKEIVGTCNFFQLEEEKLSPFVIVHDSLKKFFLSKIKNYKLK